MLNQASHEIRQRFMHEFTKELLTKTAKTPPKEFLEERNVMNLVKKLEKIFYEEGVEAIECPAPDRYLVVKKNGKLKVLNMMLEEADIEGIIYYYFGKAGMKPFNPFALSFSDMKIVGLLSSRIGSRFIIRKII